MKGGAWPFLVGGVICLVNSDNERDLDLLNSRVKCVLAFFGLFMLCYFAQTLFGWDPRSYWEGVILSLGFAFSIGLGRLLRGTICF